MIVAERNDRIGGLTRAETGAAAGRFRARGHRDRRKRRAAASALIGSGEPGIGGQSETPRTSFAPDRSLAVAGTASRCVRRFVDEFEPIGQVRAASPASRRNRQVEQRIVRGACASSRQTDPASGHAEPGAKRFETRTSIDEPRERLPIRSTRLSPTIIGCEERGERGGSNGGFGETASGPVVPLANRSSRITHFGRPGPPSRFPGCRTARDGWLPLS